jgi:hypothetical protein
MPNNTTLFNLLHDAMERAGEPNAKAHMRIYDNDLGVAVLGSLFHTVLRTKFNNSYGGFCMYSITAWTLSRVYYTAECDGMLLVKWLPRNPNAVGAPHNGFTQSI